MKSAAVPLFNYRKRQCQAILSDPQQLSKNPSSLHGSASAFDTHEESGLDRMQPAPSCVANQPSLVTSSNRLNRNPNQRDNMATNNGHRLGASSIRPRNPGLMNMEGKFSGGGAAVDTWGCSNKGWGTCQPGTPSSGSVLSTSGGRGRMKPLNAATSCGHVNEPNRNNTGRSHPFNITAPSASTLTHTKPTTTLSAGHNKIVSNCYSSTGGVNEYTNPNNFGKPGRNYQFSGSSDRGYHHDTATTTITTTAPAETSDNNTKARRSQQSQAKCYPSSNSVARWSSSRPGPHKSHWEGSSNMGAVLSERSGRDNTQKNRRAGSPTTPDLSLRIFTCNIDMVRSWTAHRDGVGLVLFEVYGVIDSALVRDRTGTGKEFILRDDTSAITCVFYEIDREIPRLVRGHVCRITTYHLTSIQEACIRTCAVDLFNTGAMVLQDEIANHRVVGSILDKLGVLQVLSVRAALVQERMICQVATELSQAEMVNLTG